MLDLPPAQVVCIAQAIYHEARGESQLGQRAVAHVILNRSKIRKKTPCAVIREPGQFQFKPRKSYKGRDWQNAWRTANFPGGDPTGGALYFHSARVTPAWKYKITTRIGNHLFYK